MVAKAPVRVARCEVGLQNEKPCSDASCKASLQAWHCCALFVVVPEKLNEIEVFLTRTTRTSIAGGKNEQKKKK
jgi:hypothetical protein